MSSAASLVVAEGGLNRMREIARALELVGVPAQIAAPPGECCGSGCGAKVQLLVAPADGRRALELLEQDWRASLPGAPPASVDGVIDLDAEHNACPACGGDIPKAQLRCPECGLRFG